MNTKQFIKIAFRIIIVFVSAMLFTFIPEHLREFFGDVPHDCALDSTCIRHEQHWNHGIDTFYEWGTRHYWFYWMAIVLFILSLAFNVIRIMEIIAKKPINEI
jgi:hypothetical protein